MGHLDVIQRAAGLYDRLVVAVGNNSRKNYLFDLEERLSLIRRVCHDIPNVEFLSFSGLLVDTAAEVGAQVIIRGLRALSDFDMEFRNGLANRDMSGIETLFLLSAPQNIYMSSSLVKEICANGGDVTRYVPPAVVSPLRKKYGV
jgi:pantetheine-phosphate adenylyltransferase